MWYDHDKSLLNLNQTSVHNAQYKDNVLKCLSTMISKCVVVNFNVMKMIDAIKALKVQCLLSKKHSMVKNS